MNNEKCPHCNNPIGISPQDKLLLYCQSKLKITESHLSRTKYNAKANKGHNPAIDDRWQKSIAKAKLAVTKWENWIGWITQKIEDEENKD